MQTHTTVQNKPATVENQFSSYTNQTVEKATNSIFRQVVELNHLGVISTDIVATLTSKLNDASFMTIDVALTDDQKEQVEKMIPDIVRDCVQKYVANIKKDERTLKVAQIVEREMNCIIGESFAAVAKETNRGAIINCTAVSADTKNKDTNKIELNYPKAHGDITIPTKGLFISTNCVQQIRDSARVDTDAALAKLEKPAAKKETKEVSNAGKNEWGA